MKKEIIYYSSGSMGPPISVELLENNKGKILDGFEEVIDLEDHKILHFWDRMNELQVWKWKSEYIMEGATPPAPKISAFLFFFSLSGRDFK